MRIRRLDDTGSTRVATAWRLAAFGALAATGCAHHRADQYAYAPPYAPPVYPQPHVEMPAQPSAYAATAPFGALPAGTVPAGAVVAGPAIAAGSVMPAGGGECPPCTTPGMDGVVVPATMVDGSGQTPPCPPGP